MLFTDGPNYSTLSSIALCDMDFSLPTFTNVFFLSVDAGGKLVASVRVFLFSEWDLSLVAVGC